MAAGSGASPLKAHIPLSQLFFNLEQLFAFLSERCEGQPPYEDWRPR